MNKTTSPIYIDVREPMEYSVDHLEGAINIPVSSISESDTRLQDIPKETRVVVYCRSGARAENARTKLQQLGFTDVENGINQETIERSIH